MVISTHAASTVIICAPGINNATFTISPSLEVAQAKLDRGIWLRMHAALWRFEVVMLSYRRSGKHIQIKCKVRGHQALLRRCAHTRHSISQFPRGRVVTL